LLQVAQQEVVGQSMDNIQQHKQTDEQNQELFCPVETVYSNNSTEQKNTSMAKKMTIDIGQSITRTYNLVQGTTRNNDIKPHVQSHLRIRI
jgi:cytochrome c-type biogenesis protein CcmH/NrfF